MKPETDCFSITPPPNAPDSARPEINLHSTETDGQPDSQLICCGYVPVVLSKMFGPLIFADLRIRAEHKTCEWIIERQNYQTLEWVEFTRIPGQTAAENQEA